MISVGKRGSESGRYDAASGSAEFVAGPSVSQWSLIRLIEKVEGHLPLRTCELTCDNCKGLFN